MSTRTCPTYNYWYDLKTDIRRPESWLDFANMILRRFRLILVKTIDGESVSWRLWNWLTFLDEIHAQGGCGACWGVEATDDRRAPDGFPGFLLILSDVLRSLRRELLALWHGAARIACPERYIGGGFEPEECERCPIECENRPKKR